MSAKLNQIKQAIAIGAIAIVLFEFVSSLMVSPIQLINFFLSLLFFSTIVCAAFRALEQPGLAAVIWTTFSIPLVVTMFFASSNSTFSLAFSILMVLAPAVAVELVFLWLKRNIVGYLVSGSVVLVILSLLLYFFNPIHAIFPNIYILIAIATIFGTAGGALGPFLFNRFLAKHMNTLFKAKAQPS